MLRALARKEPSQNHDSGRCDGKALHRHAPVGMRQNPLQSLAEQNLGNRRAGADEAHMVA